MRILAVIAKNYCNDAVSSMINILEFWGHEVFQFDYIEAAMRYGTRESRDQILLRLFYERKMDAVLLSKGHTIGSEIIKEISEHAPILFMIYGSPMSFRMHPEIFKFAEYSSVTMTDNDETFMAFDDKSIQNLYLVQKREDDSYKIFGYGVPSPELGDVKLITNKRFEKRDCFLEYGPVKISPKSMTDVGIIITDSSNSGVTDAKLKEYEQWEAECLYEGALNYIDRNDIKQFRRICSSFRIFIAPPNFSENYQSLYEKMTMCGALILDNDVIDEEEIKTLLRYYMKRKSLIDKRIDKIIKSQEIKEENVSFDEVVSEFVDILIKEAEKNNENGIN